MREKKRGKDTIFFQPEGRSIRSVCPWLHSSVSFSGIVSWCYLWLSSLLGGFIWLNIDCSSQPAWAITSISASAVSYTLLRPRGPPPWIVFMGWYDVDLNPNQLNGDLITSFFFSSKISRFTWKYHIQSWKDCFLEIYFFKYLTCQEVFKLLFFFFLETLEWIFCKRSKISINIFTIFQ